ncbi:MAG: hypothetical protein IK050_05265 [Lachnospiraceae bacterium]|nr:hypothetical protein [Lachnospiraceae bacterium]
MLSKKKIKIMFCMATYENGVGKNDLNTIKYYKSDYVRLNILKSIVSLTFAYAMILALIGMYNIDYLVKNAVKLPYQTIGFTILGIYLLLMGFYAFISISVYSLRYDAARKRMQKYFRYLKYLRKYYQSDKPASNEEESNNDA